MRVEVDCYAGYKGDERPLRLRLGDETLDVEEVQDRWYSPGETYFRVRVKCGRCGVVNVSATDVKRPRPDRPASS